jgi:hypothetical protein
MKDIKQQQLDLCKKYNADFWPVALELKLGVSENFFSGDLPLNGLRHPPEKDTNGWYLWAGEMFSSDANFFQPLHVMHLLDRCPQVLRYFGLPPGWRFLQADQYEDVWYDEKLLTL